MTPFPSTPPTGVSTTEAPAWPRSPRTLAAGRGASWWSEGWRIFMAAPVLWIGIIVVLLVITVVLNLIPLLGAFAQALLWPVFWGGLLLGCHALAQGHPLAFDHLFAGFKEGRTGPLVILGLVGLLASIVIFAILMMFGAGMAGFTGINMSLSDNPDAAAAAGIGITGLLGILLMLVAGWLFWMALFFATALVTLNRAPPLEAVKASFAASLANLGALVIFALIFFALAIAASIPFGLGWLVLGPVIFGASYAAWREVFGA